jgi:hypothetical protein
LRKLELSEQPCVFGSPIRLRGTTFFPMYDLKEAEFKRLFLEHTEGCSSGGPPYFVPYLGYKKEYW